MKDVIDKIDDQFKQVMDMQSHNLGPLCMFANVAADTVEQMARAQINKA